MSGDHLGDHFIHRVGTTQETTTPTPPEIPTNKGRDHLGDHPRPLTPGEGVEGGPCKGTTPTPHPTGPSQTLTSPQRVRYSTPMATRWSDDQKATALDALQTQTLADAHHNTGIPKPTLIRWAKAAGITVERASEKTQAAIDTNAARWAERRPIVAEKAGRLAEQALDKAASLLRAGEYLEAQRVMTVMGVSVDKAQLLSGDATARTESIAPARSPELEAEAAKILHLVEPGAAA